MNDESRPSGTALATTRTAKSSTSMSTVAPSSRKLRPPRFRGELELLVRYGYPLPRPRRLPPRLRPQWSRLDRDARRDVTTARPSTFGLEPDEVRAEANRLVRSGWSVDEVRQVLDVAPRTGAGSLEADA